MQRGKWIGFGLGAVMVAAGIGGMTTVGCSGDDNTGTSTDSGIDHSNPDTGPVSDDSGSTDTGTPVTDGGTEAAAPVLAKAYLVHAAAVAPPLRFCFGLGNPADGGTVSPAPFTASPDDDTAAKNAGLPIAGLFEGLGGPISTNGVDPAKVGALSVYAIDARTLTMDVKSNASEKTCTALLGANAVGGMTSSGVQLKPGTNFWYLGTIPAGTLAHGTTWLAGVVGCTQGGLMNDPRCPANYDNTTSDLSLQLYPLDNSTKVTGGVGVQFAHLSVASDQVFRAKYGAVATAFGFVEPPATTTTDAGSGDAGDAGDDGGDAGSTPVGPTIVPVVGDGKYLDLKPATLKTVPGLTFDGTSAVFASPLDADGGAIFPQPIAFPLPYVQKFSGLGDAGVIADGNGYVFVWVGDPTANEFVGADGGAEAPDAGGQFNIAYPHFLAFPTANP